MSKDIRIIREECCKIWNGLKDKTQMIDYLIESKQQISDLEAKLAESEKKYDKLYECYKKTSSEDLKDKYRLADEIDKLKQQLADKDAELHQIYSHLGVEAFGEDIHEQALKEIDNIKKHLSTDGDKCIAEHHELTEKVLELSKQLAESEKMIDKWSTEYNQATSLVDTLNQQLAEKDSELKRISEINLYNKDLAENTLRQLAEQPKQIIEKIREKIVDYNVKYSSAVDVLNCLDLVLDNLLKELQCE